MSPVARSIGSRIARRRERAWAIVLLCAPIAFLCILYLAPLARLLAESFWQRDFTLQHYAAIFQNPTYLRVLVWTLEMAFTTTMLCLVAGYPAAYALTRARPAARNIILALVILPFWTSSLVRAFAWLAILGRGGIVNTTLVGAGIVEAPIPLVFNSFGMYVGTVHIMLPYMIFALYSGMQGIDGSVLRAAQTLGASPSRAFWRIFVPLSLPSVAAGMLLVFVLTMGFFITPAILGGLRNETFVMVIEKLMNELMNWPLASALSAFLLALTVVLYLAFSRVFGVSGLSGASARTGASQPVAIVALSRLLDAIDRAFAPIRRLKGYSFDGRASFRRRRPAGLWTGAWAWAAVCFLVLPIAIVVLLAFSASYNLEFPPKRFSLQWFDKYFTRPEWVQATLTSFAVAFAAGLLATCLALFAAVGLRTLRPAARSLLLSLLLSPIIVPTLVYAVAIYFLFAQLGLVGTKTGMALAHTVLALPPSVVVISATLHALDTSYERAAASLGADRLRCFVHITFPLIQPSVLTALLLAFLTSFDEVVIAIFLSGASAVTLPKKMYESIRFDTDPTITAASAVLVGLTIIVLGLCELFRRRATPGTLTTTK